MQMRETNHQARDPQPAGQPVLRSQQVSRREWLTAAALTAAALPLGAYAPAWAIEPIERNGQPKFKFSLAAYSYRQLLTGREPQLTLQDFIADCAAMNLEGTELTSYYFPSDVTPEYLRQIKQHCFLLGLDVSGTAVGNDFCHPNSEARQKQMEAVKTWIRHAEILGAPVIRIFSGSARQGQTEQEAHQLAVSAIEECCDYAGQHGIFLALENHGGLTATPEGMLRLVRDVQSPWFGVNLDTGNFHGEDVYAELEQLAPYSLNVQVKVVIKPADGSHQPIDFSRIAKMLRDVNYRGYVVLEYEEAEDPRVACPRYMDQMREAFA